MVVIVPVGGLGKFIVVLWVAILLDGLGIFGGVWGFVLIYILVCGGVIVLFGWVWLRCVVVGPI